MNKDKIKKIFNKIGLDIYRHDNRYYRTTYLRPKYACDVRVNEQDFCFGKKVAIIIQGAIKHEDDFTLESVKLYRKLYPNSFVIISTWSEEPHEYLRKIEALEAKVIQNEKPLNPGHGSINYQLKTTKAAIDLAVEKGCEYILKTRTDQRIYGEGNLSYLMQILWENPLHIETKAKGRLITCNNGCFSGRLYNISDMVLFGYSEDILAYYSCSEDIRNNPIIDPGNDMVMYSQKRPGEIYFSSNYIEYLGFELQWTEADSLYYIKELFLIIDNEALDWYWPKYTDSEYRWRDYSGRKLRQLTNKDWKRL